jgi:hypothetical protein
MPVGVNVRDSFRSRRGYGSGSLDRPRHRFHRSTVGHATAESTGRPWATVGKGPDRVLVAVADAEARVPSFQICVGTGQPWSAEISLQCLLWIIEMVQVASTVTVFPVVVRHCACKGRSVACRLGRGRQGTSGLMPAAVDDRRLTVPLSRHRLPISETPCPRAAIHHPSWVGKSYSKCPVLASITEGSNTSGAETSCIAESSKSSRGHHQSPAFQHTRGLRLLIHLAR